MRVHQRRRLMTAFAILAGLAVAAKIYKAYYRGDTMQSRVRVVN